MTEDEARQWIHDRHGQAATDRLSRFADMVLAGAEHQNLVAPSTLPMLWSRHIVDSAQLLPLVPPAARSWVDIGTGAGFPGMVVALLFEGPVTLIEPRARRATFLRDAAEALDCRCIVHQARAETCASSAFDVISARAVASIDTLFDMTAALRHPATTYVLPRGRSGADEVLHVRQQWRGKFHVEHSLTDPRSSIVVAQGVER